MGWRWKSAVLLNCTIFDECVMGKLCGYCLKVIKKSHFGSLGVLCWSTWGRKVINPIASQCAYIPSANAVIICMYHYPSTTSSSPNNLISYNLRHAKSTISKTSESDQSIDPPFPVPKLPVLSFCESNISANLQFYIFHGYKFNRTNRD